MSECAARSENECCCDDVDWRSQREIELEQDMTDPEQRKHWHSVRAKIKESKRLANVAFNDMIGEKPCTP